MGRQCGQTIVVEDLDDAFVGRDVQLKVFDQQKQSRHIKNEIRGDHSRVGRPVKAAQLLFCRMVDLSESCSAASR
jgi:hypothetical protein